MVERKHWQPEQSPARRRIAELREALPLFRYNYRQTRRLRHFARDRIFTRTRIFSVLHPGFARHYVGEP